MMYGVTPTVMFEERAVAFEKLFMYGKRVLRLQARSLIHFVHARLRCQVRVVFAFLLPSFVRVWHVSVSSVRWWKVFVIMNLRWRPSDGDLRMSMLVAILCGRE